MKSMRAIRGLHILALAAVLGATLSTQSCSWFRKKKKTEDAAAVPSTYEPPKAPENNSTPPPAPTEGPRVTGELRDVPESDMSKVYFDFDRSEIRADQVEKMEKNLKFLKDTPAAKILVEGHCDERGTTEYNLSLGERRARTVQNYFVNGGIDGSRIQVLSKGEEEPADPGHDETAWAQNRRAQFKRFD